VFVLFIGCLRGDGDVYFGGKFLGYCYMGIEDVHDHRVARARHLDGVPGAKAHGLQAIGVRSVLDRHDPSARPDRTPGQIAFLGGNRKWVFGMHFNYLFYISNIRALARGRGRKEDFP